MNFESSRTHVSLTDFGSARWMEGMPRPHAFDHRHGVLAHRAPDVELHGRLVAVPDRRGRPLEAVLRVADVGHPNRRAVHRRDDDVVEVLAGVDPAERPEQQLAFALLDGAPGDLDVLRDDGVAHLRDRQPVRVELLDVDDDVDLARAGAGDRDLADAVDRLNRPRHLLVRDLGERPQAHRVGRHHQRHDRIRVGIDLGDDGRQQFGRHALDRAGDLLADVVGRVVQIAFENEANGDVAAAFADARGDFVDAGDAADRLFHRLDDRRGDLVRAGAGQRQARR